jgi:hypothetical protein
MRKIISGILILSFLLGPLTVFAQTAACSPLSTSNYEACCYDSSDGGNACSTFFENQGSSATTSSTAASTAANTPSAIPAACNGLSGSSLTQCENTQASKSSLAQYNPNVNISAGNTYGGSSGSISISGVGGAIASCLNVGSFLINGAASLLAQTSIGQSVEAAFGFKGGSSNAVATSDSTTQSDLATQNRTTQCLNGVAYAVAKNTLAQVTNKTLNWVNNGLNGNPLYVQNTGSYLQSVQNQQTTSFLNTVQSSDPIFGNALRSAITFELTGKSDGLISSSMNNSQSQAYNSFTSNFTNGGWNALLNPSYNPIGALLTATDQLNSNISSSQQNASNQIQRNSGFLDMQRCVAYSSSSSTGLSSGGSSLTSSLGTTISNLVFSKTPPAGQGTNQCTASTINNDSTYELCCTGQSAEDSVACNNYATADATAAGSPECANITNDSVYDQCCNGDSGDSAMCVAYNNYGGDEPAQSKQNSAASTNSAIQTGLSQSVNGLSNQPACTQWTTTTPGSVIASQVNTVTTTPVRQLEYANQINEVLGSFFDSFVNNLLSQGLRGSGSSNQALNLGLSSQGDNIVTDSNGNQLDSSSDGEQALGYQSTTGGDVDTGDFDISRPQQLRAILQTQYDYLDTVQDAQIALERIIPVIGALDYCIPGPNPDWQTNLDSNWQTFIGGINQADPKDESTVEKLIGDLPTVGPLVEGIVSLFTGSGTAPALWSSDSVLTDKITGSGVEINRIFYAPSNHSDGVKTSDLEAGLNDAYDLLTSPSQYGYFTPSANGGFSDPVQTAFQTAAANDPDPTYVNGFLQQAYTETDSLTGYNEAATEIEQQYSQDISNTQNDIQQLEQIRQQVDDIVATAKARYIAQRAAEGDPVNMTCINDAYEVDTSAIVGTPREEPDDSNPLHAEEDSMEQHSINSSSYFYNNEIK